MGVSTVLKLSLLSTLLILSASSTKLMAEDLETTVEDNSDVAKIKDAAKIKDVAKIKDAAKIEDAAPIRKLLLKSTRLPFRWKQTKPASAEPCASC